MAIDVKTWGQDAFEHFYRVKDRRPGNEGQWVGVGFGRPRHGGGLSDGG